ncbi:hypothetical protein ES703_95940 [subsurface metagenome]
MSKLWGPGFIFIILLAFTGCARLTVSKPAGFAESRDRGLYRAVSPEGLLYKVHLVKNYPEQELEFWGRALKNHLTREGYYFTGREESFRAGDRPGILYEWGLPYGNEDYIYLTAIVVFDKKIAVAEAAGVHTVFRQYRQALLDSIKSIACR